MRKLSIENNCICFSELVGKSSLEVRDFLLHFRTHVDQVLPDGVYNNGGQRRRAFIDFKGRGPHGKND